MREAQIQAGLVYKVDRQQGPTVRHGQLCSISYNKTIMQENMRNIYIYNIHRTSLVAQTVKCLSLMWETQVRSLGWEDPLEKEMAIYSSTLAWKIPWTEEPGRLQPMGSQRVRHD